MIVTLRKTIPSGSHNAPYSEELGEHWPEGQQFKVLEKRRQKSCQRFYRTKPTSTIVEQIGGEEVLVTIPNDKFVELFGIESPYAVNQSRDDSIVAMEQEAL
jgi:hypothetical protein